MSVCVYICALGKHCFPKTQIRILMQHKKNYFKNGKNVKDQFFCKKKCDTHIHIHSHILTHIITRNDTNTHNDTYTHTHLLNDTHINIHTFTHTQ